MDKTPIYPGQIPLDTNWLQPQRNTEIALGFLMQAAFGTRTLIDGLAVTPTAPASMQVDVGPGAIIFLTTVDTLTTGFGSLTVDDSDPLVKIGINLTSTAMGALTAPGTAGYSQNWLIEAQFIEADGAAVSLPYYNAANPSVPYTGPSNSGATSNTARTNRVQLQWKAGTAAATGSQTTPAPDSGWIGVAVVTVENGQSSIVAGNISVYSAAPSVNYKLGDGAPFATVAASALSANYTIEPNDGGKFFPVTSAVTITINPATLVAGQTVGFWGDGAAATLVASSGAFKGGAIDGATSVVVPSGGWLFVQTDGTNLRSVAGSVSVISQCVASVNPIVFTSSGTYTPSPGLLFARVRVIGGGGGGGGATSSANGLGSSGGGAGGTAEGQLTAAQIGASIAITIGAGGAFGSAGTGGSAGGTTSFGGLLYATGGAGGQFFTGSEAISPGGVGHGGSFGAQGQSGGIAVVISSSAVWGGDGGAAMRGGAGGRGVDGVAEAGHFPGGGGASAGGTTGLPGAAGAQGSVEIIEYIGAYVG